MRQGKMSLRTPMAFVRRSRTVFVRPNLSRSSQRSREFNTLLDLRVIPSLKWLPPWRRLRLLDRLSLSRSLADQKPNSKPRSQALKSLSRQARQRIDSLKELRSNTTGAESVFKESVKGAAATSLSCQLIKLISITRLMLLVETCLLLRNHSMYLRRPKSNRNFHHLGWRRLRVLVRVIVAMSYLQFKSLE